MLERKSGVGLTMIFPAGFFQEIFVEGVAGVSVSTTGTTAPRSAAATARAGFPKTQIEMADDEKYRRSDN
jgi:hypothetical protein